MPLRVGIGDLQLNKPLLLWINDGLMTIFFFVVGLEIKREVVAGELSEFRKAILPVVAALGGMVAPAVIYLLLQWGQPAGRGWGIPMATDIAFVVGFLALLGARVPAGLKVLLLSLAIADDVGAAVVIAVVYSSDFSLVALGCAGAVVGGIVLFQRIGVRGIPAYLLLGAGLWLALLKAGVHPTMAGVILGLLTPARPWVGDRVPLDLVTDLFRRVSREAGRADHHEIFSPVERLERALHPWVAFGIMPLFALANAGVVIAPAGLAHPVALAVAAGLVLGKPLGILLFCWIAVQAGAARLPEEINWPVLLGGGCLAGIGFTMSLFIAGLAMTGPELEEAKVGIVVGSAISAVLGCALLLRVLPQSSAASVR
jgi:NhaA family Na+:H+ antiporter